MKLLVLTTLLSTVLSELDPATLRANGLSRVVRVGRTGRQVVHANRIGDGKRLGKKVRRKGRQNLLLTSSLPTAPVGLPHNPFGFSHVQFNSAPAPFSPLVPAAPQQLVRVAAPQPFVRAQTAQQLSTQQANNIAAPQPFIRALPAQPFTSQRVIPFNAPKTFVRAQPAQPLAPQPIISQPLPLLRAQPPQPLAPIVAPQPLPLLRAQSPKPLAPILASQPIVRAQPLSFLPATPSIFKSIPLEYGTPATIAPEVKVQAPAGAYGAPIRPAVEEQETVTVAPAAVATEVVAARAPTNSYIAVPSAATEVEATPASVAEVVASRAPSEGYISVPEVKSKPKAVVKSNIKAATRSEPIPIIRSHANVPAETAAFDYSFETANGIKQSAVGSVRTVDDTEVSVMEGSYEYIGAEGVVYTVEWFADESGFHATAPHLPRNVVPNHPEVAAAVKAQLEEAAVKVANRRRASPASSSYAVLESDELASYQ